MPLFNIMPSKTILKSFPILLRKSNARSYNALLKNTNQTNTDKPVQTTKLSFSKIASKSFQNSRNISTNTDIKQALFRECSNSKQSTSIDLKPRLTIMSQQSYSDWAERKIERDDQRVKDLVDNIKIYGDKFKFFSLNDATLSNQSWRLLTDAIETSTSIHTFSLNNVALSDQAWKDLIDVIETSTSIREFFLKGVKLSDIRMKHMMDMIKTNTSIDLISLSKITLSNQARNDLVDAFVHNSSIRFFSSGMLLYNNEIEGTIIKDHLKMNREIRDLVQDFINSILLPKILSKNHEKQIKEDFIANNAFDDLNQIVRNILFKDLTKKEIITINNKWHSQLSQAKILKEKNYRDIEWSPLFTTKEIAIPENITYNPGWKAVCLTNPSELKLEGKALNHCVGGYSNQCLNGNTHIISIRDSDNKPISTMQVELQRGNTYKIIQHFGYDNGAISTTSKQIEKYLEKTHCSNINYAQLEMDRQTRISRNVTILSKNISHIGFDYTDPKKVKKIQKIYSEILPLTPDKEKDRAKDKFVINLDTERKIKDNYKRLLALKEIIIKKERVLLKSEPLEKPEKIIGKTKKIAKSHANKIIKTDLETVLKNLEIDAEITEMDQKHKKIVIKVNDVAKIELYEQKIKEHIQSSTLGSTTNNQTISISHSENSNNIIISGLAPKSLSDIIKTSSVQQSI